jgi:hypothetical protein
VINLLSIRCTLAFAPYLSECLTAFDQHGTSRSIVVQQGGFGLIIRTEGDLVIRHQGNQVNLNRESARHFLATIGYRARYYDVIRMSDEVVIASVPSHVYLSFPQSECWLRGKDVDAMLSVADPDPVKSDSGPASFSDWLVASWSGTALLLSDQRNGRWVLLSSQHLEQIQRRRSRLRVQNELNAGYERPRRLQVKGIELPLQVAFEVARALEAFAAANEICGFEERSPLYQLSLRASSEGLELRNSDRYVRFNKREAAKWALIINEELKRLNAIRFERGPIRTVIADAESGRWVLQCGDEVRVPSEHLSVSREGEWLIGLDPGSGNCVALTNEEARAAGC